MADLDGAQKKPKHLILDAAINELEKIDGALQRLRTNITEEESPPMDETKQREESKPNLVYILEKGPARIRNTIERCIKRIEEIQTILF